MTVVAERQQEILSVVRKFLEDIGQDPDRIGPESKLRDLGIDSLHAVDLVFRFEERFEINIPMEDFHATTVAEAVDFMIGVLSNKSDSTAAG